MQLRAAVLVLLAGCTPDGGVTFMTSVGSGFATSGASSSEGGEAGEPPPPPPPPGTPTTGATGASGADSEGEAGTGEAPASGTLVAARAGWRYSGGAPADGWTALEFDDATWPEGQAPLGDDGDVATVVDTGAAPVGAWLRRRFTAASGPAQLMLYLRRGDGAAVYLNGAELLRSNLPAGDLGTAVLAEDDLDGDEVHRYLRFVVPADALRDGDNVIAVALRRAAAGEPGLGFDLQLDVFDPAALAADELRVQWRTRSYGGEYASENVGAAWIERAGGGFVRTLMVWAEVRREHLVRWQAGAGGDLVDAVTGATRGRHRTSEVAWDLRDGLGQTAPPGEYTLLLEFTEEDSNKGEPPGPRLELPFTLGAGPGARVVPEHPQFRDVLVIAP